MLDNNAAVRVALRLSSGTRDRPNNGGIAPCWCQDLLATSCYADCCFRKHCRGKQVKQLDVLMHVATGGLSPAQYHHAPCLPGAGHDGTRPLDLVQLGLIPRPDSWSWVAYIPTRPLVTTVVHAEPGPSLANLEPTCIHEEIVLHLARYRAATDFSFYSPVHRN